MGLLLNPQTGKLLLGTGGKLVYGDGSTTCCCLGCCDFGGSEPTPLTVTFTANGCDCFSYAQAITWDGGAGEWNVSGGYDDPCTPDTTNIQLRCVTDSPPVPGHPDGEHYGFNKLSSATCPIPNPGDGDHIVMTVISCNPFHLIATYEMDACGDCPDPFTLTIEITE